MTLDPDPLHVDDERIPSSKPYRLVPDSPRRGCSVLGFIVLASLVFVGSAAPRSGSDGSLPNMAAVDGGVRMPPPVHLALTGAPLASVAQLVEHRPFAARRPGSEVAGSSPARWSGAPQDASAVTFEGTLAYADPSYGPLYLAIRQPRGTRVEVCGPADCLIRVSTDYGPTLEMARQGRIADLSAADWSRVCGVPLAFGLCPGTLTLVGLPQTDQ